MLYSEMSYEYKVMNTSSPISRYHSNERQPSRAPPVPNLPYRQPSSLILLQSLHLLILVTTLPPPLRLLGFLYSLPHTLLLLTPTTPKHQLRLPFASASRQSQQPIRHPHHAQPPLPVPRLMHMFNRMSQYPPFLIKLKQEQTLEFFRLVSTRRRRWRRRCSSAEECVHIVRVWSRAGTVDVDTAIQKRQPPTTAGAPAHNEFFGRTACLSISLVV